jgi:hypothetical protein
MIQALPEAKSATPASQDTGFTSRLPMARDFLDFLRLGLGWERTTPTRAALMQQRIEELIEESDGH